MDKDYNEIRFQQEHLLVYLHRYQECITGLTKVMGIYARHLNNDDVESLIDTEYLDSEVDIVNAVCALLSVVRKDMKGAFEYFSEKLEKTEDDTSNNGENDE